MGCLFCVSAYFYGIVLAAWRPFRQILIPTKLSGYIAILYFVKTDSNYYLYTLNAT